MCDIITDHPDAHVTATIGQISAICSSAMQSLAACAERIMLEQRYLGELSEHKMLKTPLPELSAIRQKVVEAIQLAITDYKKAKDVERSTIPEPAPGKPKLQVYEWSIPETLVGQLAEWFVTELLK